MNWLATIGRWSLKATYRPPLEPPHHIGAGIILIGVFLGLSEVTPLSAAAKLFIFTPPGFFSLALLIYWLYRFDEAYRLKPTRRAEIVASGLVLLPLLTLLIMIGINLRHT
jgi:hypothetical protein